MSNKEKTKQETQRVLGRFRKNGVLPINPVTASRRSEAASETYLSAQESAVIIREGGKDSLNYLHQNQSLKP